MLAYTFFHWPREGAADYERHLGEFFRAMEADKPLGYLGGLSMRHGPASWLSASAYLDWYRVSNFADLGMLNEGAVSGSRRAPHDDVAAMAAGGAGGVYELQQGPAGPKLRWSWRCATSNRTGAASPPRSLLPHCLPA